MAVLLSNTALLFPSLSSLPRQFPSRPSVGSSRRRRRFSASAACSSSSSLSAPMEGRSNFTDFPHVSAPHRSLMLDLLSAVESRLGPQLHPCDLPPDVEYYQNEGGTARGSLHVRRGHSSSPVDFVLGSWLNCQLPTGGALNITSLSAYLKTSTDAPNFLFELIQSGPASLIMILDLTPRKDLVMSPDYLKTFYEDTQLDSHRKALEGLPEARPYFSSALYIRSVVSPTAIMLKIETDSGGKDRLEEIVGSQLSPISKAVLEIWLDKCANGENRDLDEAERAYLEKRDGVVKRKTIDIDLASNFPRLFGPEIAGRVIEVLREVYSV